LIGHCIYCPILNNFLQGIGYIPVTKKQFNHELARIIEKLCDGSQAARDEFLLHESICIEYVIGVAAGLAPKRRGRKGKVQA
jgi:hypothetical protein